MYNPDIKRKPKPARAEHARNHLDDMAARYGHEIQSSVDGSRIIVSVPANKTDPAGIGSDIRLLPYDTVTALFKIRQDPEEKICVLNFASYTRAGGGFLTGATAQEEMLCHASDLCNVLLRFEREFYDVNRKQINNGLYGNRMLYSPGVIFEKLPRVVTKADVLTCAAPNISRNRSVPTERNTAELQKRIDIMFSILESKNIDVFLTGAWGCGVFGQNPKEIASLMLDRAEKSSIRRVVFSIPDKAGDNFRAFSEILNARKERRETP